MQISLAIPRYATEEDDINVKQDITLNGTVDGTLHFTFKPICGFCQMIPAYYSYEDSDVLKMLLDYKCGLSIICDNCGFPKLITVND